MTNLRVNTELSADGQSVLYVLESSEPVNSAPLIAAQQLALRLKLPFATVAVIPEDDATARIELLRTLSATEKKLKGYNIPLITLLGDPEVVLAALVHHVKPRTVFNQYGLSKLTQNTLAKHPYGWPGTVITTNQLIDIVESDTSTCL